MDTEKLPKGMVRRPDGRYMARFQYKKEKYCLYDYDMEKLQNRINSLKEDVKSGIYRKEGSMTLNEWFEIWVNEYKKDNVKEATVFRYRSAYEKHVKNVLGNIKLKNVHSEDIQKLYDGLEGTTTVEIVSTILTGMFKQAFKNNLINSNPVQHTVVPKNKNVKSNRRVLTVPEQKILLNYCDGTLRDLIEVTLSTGLRTGEIRALEWDNIDFENKEIDVRGTLTEIGGRYFKDIPKTKSSIRDIPMLPNVEKIFLRREREQKEKKELLGDRYKIKNGLDNLVFDTGKGTPISNSGYVRMLNRAVDKINSDGIEFEHIHPHTLRHTFAVRCIEKGIPPQVLKEILGHSSLSMTMELYSDAMPDAKAEEMKKIETLFIK